MPAAIAHFRGRRFYEKGTGSMWSVLFTARNRFVAELWKELFDAEGVATRIVVDGDPAQAGDLTPRLVYVPDSKTHVAEEILRKV